MKLIYQVNVSDFVNTTMIYIEKQEPMPEHIYSFDQVTLLVTHYNRSASLERLLHAFADLNCEFGDIVVSDDGSKPYHLEKLNQLKEKYPFRLIKTPTNKGLGNNINKGQDAVNTPYTLYVQEDFVPKPLFAERFNDALTIMQQDHEMDIIRFYAYFEYPYTRPYGNGFLQMVFKAMPWYSNHLKFYFYSDHPHLRRSNFLTRFGRYPEGISGDATEFTMALSVIKHKGKGLFYEGFADLFDQMNSPDEPSTMNRADWRQSETAIVQLLRWAYLKYRFLKNNLQLILSK